jgi:hypothetical protein
MKMLLSILLISSTTLITGCYTVLSLNEEPEELNSTTLSAENNSGSYFDEEIDTEEVDSNYEFAAENLELETEPTFLEILISEIISGLSNISYSDDVIIYEHESDNSSTSNENSTNERDHSSTRNSGDRNYKNRK